MNLQSASATPFFKPAAPEQRAIVHRVVELATAAVDNRLSDETIQLSSDGSAAMGSVDEAIRVGNELARQDPARPIFGVMQAQDGVQLLRLVEGGPASGQATPYSDRFMDLVGTDVVGRGRVARAYENVVGSSPGLVALVGAAAWRDVQTNHLHSL